MKVYYSIDSFIFRNVFPGHQIVFNFVQKYLLSLLISVIFVGICNYDNNNNKIWKQLFHLKIDKSILK